VVEYRLEVAVKKQKAVVDIRKFEDRLKAFEKKGIEVEVIGRKDRFQERRRIYELTRFLNRLVLRHKNRHLVIGVVDAPELRGKRVSMLVALDIPMNAKGAVLTKAEKNRLESFLDHAILRGKGVRQTPSRRRRSSAM
jgi:hypothetical protein